MKINKTLIILSLLLIFCISLGAVSAADDADMSVNDINNDDVATVESSVMNKEIDTVNAGEIGNFSSLNSLIQESGSNIIYLNKDYKYNPEDDFIHISKDRGIVINKDNIVIEGNGHTIDGSSLDGSNIAHIFLISGKNVTIQGINFRNVNNTGHESGGGSAIYFGGSGSVVNCNFTNCFSNVIAYGYPGGAISCGYNCIVSGCSFVNCTASGEYANGGAIYWEGAYGSVSGCSFVNCSARSGGGAICFDSMSDGFVSGCSFVNCSARSGGGAIYAICDINVNNSNFTGCAATNDEDYETYGGAISIESSNCSINYCIFDNNVADYGGAISIYDSDCSINYCIFDNNVADWGMNIAIGEDYGFLSSVNLDFNFFTFQNNITSFPNNFIVLIKYDEEYNENITSVSPDNWVVLDIVKSGGEYVCKFVLNDASDLSKSMPDFTANLAINGVTKDICIKNNTFKDTFVKGTYLLTSLNTGNVLVNTTLNRSVPIYEIDLWDCEYGETAIINIMFKEERVTGEVTVKVRDDYIITRTINDKNRVSFSISALSPGVHNLNISYSGDDVYLPFNTTAIVTVSGSPEYSMNVSVDDISYGVVAVVDVTLPIGANRFVRVYLDGVYYGDAGVTNGKAQFNFTNLNVGKYNVTVEYAGDNLYPEFSNSTLFTVTAKNVNITLSPITNYTVLSGKNYTVTFTSEGEAIDGAKVIFELVNGDIKKNYTVYTDSEGKASLPINLAYTKEYIFNIYFNNTGYEYTVTNQTITVTVGNATFIDNFTDKTFNSTLMSGDNFTIQLVDEKDKGIAGVYVDLDFKKGETGTTITYKVKTDSEGNVRLPLNLKCTGDYYLTAKYGEISEDYTINILKSIINPLAKPTNLTNNYTGKFVTTKNSNKEFVVKLTSETQPVKNAIIKFELSNKNESNVYYVSTDSNGEAKLAINLSYVGNYTMKVVFEGNNLYAPSNESSTSVEIKEDL